MPNAKRVKIHTEDIIYFNGVEKCLIQRDKIIFGVFKNISVPILFMREGWINRFNMLYS